MITQGAREVPAHEDSDSSSDYACDDDDYESEEDLTQVPAEPKHACSRR